MDFRLYKDATLQKKMKKKGDRQMGMCMALAGQNPGQDAR